MKTPKGMPDPIKSLENLSKPHNMEKFKLPKMPSVKMPKAPAKKIVQSVKQNDEKDSPRMKHLKKIYKEKPHESGWL